jgi:methylphosphotriester-DNA--protein-cysteine methyltransferase
VNIASTAEGAERATTSTLVFQPPGERHEETAGFADQSHFTRAFKRVSGMTPGAYRNLAWVQDAMTGLTILRHD